VGQYFYNDPAGKSNSSFLQNLLQNATAEELLKLVYICQMSRKKSQCTIFTVHSTHASRKTW